MTPGDDNEDDDREYVRNRLLLLVGQALMKLYNERLYRTLLSPYPSRAQQGGEQKGSYALKHVIMLAHHDDDQVRREFLDYILKLVLQQRLRFGKHILILLTFNTHISLKSIHIFSVI